MKKKLLFNSTQEPAAQKYDVTAAKNFWIDRFNEALYVLLDCEMGAQQARKTVAIAAEVADAALDELERRWPMTE